MYLKNISLRLVQLAVLAAQRDADVAFGADVVLGEPCAHLAAILAGLACQSHGLYFHFGVQAKYPEDVLELVDVICISYPHVAWRCLLFEECPASVIIAIFY